MASRAKAGDTYGLTPAGTANRRGAGAWLAGLLAVAWLWLMVGHTANLPFFDDFDQLLASTLDLAAASSPGRFADLLLEQHNEDRPAVVRMLAWLDYSLFGRLSFQHLAGVGNAMLALAVLVLLAASRSPWRVALPVALLVFSLQTYETATFATASLQYHGLLLFAMLALRHLTSPGALSLGLGLFCACLALFTHIGAIALHLALAATLAVSGRFGRLAALALALTPLYAFFFKGYAFPSLTSSSPGGLAYLAKAAAFCVAYLGSLVGGLSLWKPSLAFLPVMAGTALLGATLYFVLARRYYRDNTLIWGVMLFMLLLAAETAVGRMDMGLRQAVSPRYSTYSLFLAGAVFICLADAGPAWPPAQGRIILALAITVFWVGSSALYYPVMQHRHREQTLVARSTVSEVARRNYPKHLRQRALYLLERSDRLGLYRLGA